MKNFNIKQYCLMNLLEQLKQQTKVVADTGDFASITTYKPIDATTNPSLIYSASQNQKYQHLIDDAVLFAKKNSSKNGVEQLSLAMDKLAVNFGLEILKIVEGRVSTEVDARLSFDTEGTIKKARQIIALYKEAGIEKERILIKIAATWEGIEAAKILEKEGIHCNLTLLFSQIQAIACAEADVKLISPFVGRILDWHKKARSVDEIPAKEDPGVISVTNIFNYYKKFRYKTEIMGASFRNIGEICELAGCDLLTISPALLHELQNTEGKLEKKLDEKLAMQMEISKIELDDRKFRWLMNEDAMATEKLAEGIRNFTKDLLKLEAQIAKLL